MLQFDGALASLGTRRFAACAALLSALALPAAAAGLVTIVEGEATVVDGARTLIVSEGLKLPDDVILRTGARTGIVRVEWPDGTIADFGPDTQALINPAGFAARGGRPPSLYLLRGWVKQAGSASTASGGFVSPRLDVQPFKGTIVAQVSADETWVFGESGALQVVERDAKPALPVAVKSGEVYARLGTAKGSVAPRPTPAQMQRVPRGFRDTLPARAAALKDRQVEPRLAAPANYAELEEWLKLPEPTLRRSYPRRFAARARDSAFRAALVQHLGAHPEWERLLFPERFLPPASAPR